MKITALKSIVTIILFAACLSIAARGISGYYKTIRSDYFKNAKGKTQYFIYSCIQ